jgi:hypothetical protein
MFKTTAIIYMIAVYAFWILMICGGLGIIVLLGYLAYEFQLQTLIIFGSILFLWIAYKFFGPIIRNSMNLIGTIFLAIIVIIIFGILPIIFLLNSLAEWLYFIANNIIYIVAIVLIIFAFYIWTKD